MSRTKLLMVVALVGAWSFVYAQADRAEFEVASVRPSGPGGGQKGIRPYGGGRVTIIGLTVRELVRAAYGDQTILMANQVTGGPSWVDSDSFDIIGLAGRSSAPGGVLPHQRMLALLRSLLQDRFRLVTHTETRELPIYALVLDRADGRLGPKLRPASTGCTPLGGNPSAGAPWCGFNNGPSRLSGLSVTMDLLAGVLAQQPDVGRIVRNRTGLAGAFDADAEFARLVPGNPATTTAGVPDGPSLFTALREQLGVRLESERGPVDVVVIDRVEKPTEN